MVLLSFLRRRPPLPMLERLCPDPHEFVSNPGERYKQNYIGDVQSDGSVLLVPSGKDDLWMMHNAAKEDCDINNIVARFCAGDVSVLSRRQGFYGDFTEMPSNLAEFMNAGVDTMAAYNNLPDDIKEKFPDMQSWLSSLSSGEFLEYIKTRGASVQPDEKEKEVTE